MDASGNSDVLKINLVRVAAASSQSFDISASITDGIIYDDENN